jgi:hypothetical protein
VALAALGGVLSSSCDSDGLGAFGGFADSAAGAICHRTFECCADVDAVALTTVTDEAACAKAYAQSLRRRGADAINLRLARYDAAAGAQCLDDLNGPCSALFSRSSGSLVPCQHVFVGTGVLGAVCDDDFVCESNACEGQRCVLRPTAMTCPAMEFFDATQGGCLPVLDPGAACTLDKQCAAGLACLDGMCAPQRSDGEPCNLPSQCTGTCSVARLTPGGGMCRPAFCQGR